jgi:hypothetical protein
MPTEINKKRESKKDQVIEELFKICKGQAFHFDHSTLRDKKDFHFNP